MRDFGGLMFSAGAAALLIACVWPIYARDKPAVRIKLAFAGTVATLTGSLILQFVPGMVMGMLALATVGYINRRVRTKQRRTAYRKLSSRPLSGDTEHGADIERTDVSEEVRESEIDSLYAIARLASV